MTKLDAEYDDSGWDKVEELVQEEAIEEYNTQVSSIGNSGPFYGKAGLTEASVMPRQPQKSRRWKKKMRTGSISLSSHPQSRDMIKFDRPQLNTPEFTWPDWENFPLKGGDKMELTKVEKDRLAALKAKKDLTPAEKAELDALKAKELK